MKRLVLHQAFDKNLTMYNLFKSSSFFYPGFPFNMSRRGVFSPDVDTLNTVVNLHLSYP